MVVYMVGYNSSNQQGLRLDIEEEYYLGWSYSSESAC